MVVDYWLVVDTYQMGSVFLPRADGEDFRTEEAEVEAKADIKMCVPELWTYVECQVTRGSCMWNRGSPGMC